MRKQKNKNEANLFNLPFHSLSIIAVIPITNFPFPVLVVAPAHGLEQVFEGELLFEPFALLGICRQQVGTCLFFGKEEYLRMAKVVKDNSEVMLAILVLGDGDRVRVYGYVLTR